MGLTAILPRNFGNIPKNVKILQDIVCIPTVAFFWDYLDAGIKPFEGLHQPGMS
jgi:hypothetical protein